MSAIVTVDRLSKRYGKRLAVDAVSFEVAHGEVMGLLGPNGSGKSTILRLLSGYLKPTSGTARVGGFDIVAQGLDVRRQVGYVPEDVPLYTHMRVKEFLAFMGRLHRLEGAALDAAVASVCERVALRAVTDVMIGTLSRGYRQRVGIARALLGNPKLLILDEPTNGLDPRQIIELRELIRSLARSSAVLVTSHVLAEIERVAHRAAILLEGRLLAVHRITERGDAGQRLVIRIRRQDPAAVHACLDRAGGVRSVRYEGQPDGIDAWHIETEDAGGGERAVAALACAGFPIREVGAAASDLEGVFLHLTREVAR